jgi:drug/metabolite transporter (DMT)-like permease
MVLIMSFIGVVTSLFLKVLDSVRKAIASALELVFLPLLSTILFGVPLTLSMVVSVVFVASGVYIYSLPVDTKSAKSSSAETHKVAVDDLKNGDEDSKA